MEHSWEEDDEQQGEEQECHAAQRKDSEQLVCGVAQGLHKHLHMYHPA
jgi:hypothetical protein